MTFRAFYPSLLAIFLVTASWGGAAIAEPPNPPALNPAADKMFSGMCEALGSANAFSFHAEVLFEQVLPSAVKVQYAGAMDFTVQRPGELAVNYKSDTGAKELWYGDGKLTLFDPGYDMYATIAAPGTIDAMLDEVARKQELTMPLSDLAYSNPCARPKKIAIYSGYLGVNDVNGVACDHLAYSSADTDFQIWIQHSGKPVPRKIVISHRTEPGSPEYIAVLSDWKFPKEIAAAHFQPDLPKDARRIEFLKVEESKR